MKPLKKIVAAAVTMSVCIAFQGGRSVNALPFDAGIATYEQTAPNGPWTAALAIDGNTSGVWDFVHPNGWGVYDVNLKNSDPTTSQTAYFRLTNAMPLNAPTDGIELKMYFNFDVNPFHSLGSFRISATTADLHASAFNLTNAAADSWVTMSPSSFVLTPSSGPAPTYSVDGSNVILVNSAPPQVVYDLVFKPGVMNITGIRLEALNNAALPTNGPGYSPDDGNFTLNEITAQAVPEPASLSLLAVGGVILLTRRRQS